MLSILSNTWQRTFLVLIALFLAGSASAQQQQNQNIPDAPSATRPPQTFPTTPSVDTTPPPSDSAPPAAPANGAPPRQASGPPDQPIPGQEGAPSPGPPPPMKISTVPEGGATGTPPPANEELYKIVTNVNQVIIPVRVTDDSGRIVNGLLPKDFSVYEDGKKQNLNFFTSDPFALSAAIVIDLGMPDVAVQKVNKTFAALQGAFGPYDEVSVYTYSNTVGRAMDFNAANAKLTGTFDDLSNATGRNNSPPITGGPLGPGGPYINGAPVDPQTPAVITPPTESHVLNDAILAAAQGLGKRDKSRRKIVFVISNGREYRSQASYKDVLKVLLTNGITVYGIGVDTAAIPVYNKIGKLHLPKMGYTDILPKYASATAGEVYNEYSKLDIENVYSRALNDARNQYALGYVTQASFSESYRQIEVRVDRPGCDSDLRPCVSVYARDGYYPLPSAR